MARFDVYRSRGTGPLLLDCQADLLDALDTRFVVPLLAHALVPAPMARLNPVFTVAGERVVMATHLAAAIPVRELAERVARLSAQQDTITAALDMLLVGF